jgi:hypothetical protein
MGFAIVLHDVSIFLCGWEPSYVALVFQTIFVKGQYINIKKCKKN